MVSGESFLQIIREKESSLYRFNGKRIICYIQQQKNLHKSVMAKEYFLRRTTEEPSRHLMVSNRNKKAVYMKFKQFFLISPERSVKCFANVLFLQNLHQFFLIELNEMVKFLNWFSIDFLCYVEIRCRWT